MTRRVFYSFYYADDCDRAAQVRNMGVVDGNRPSSDNDWEAVKKGGEAAIKNWIAEQLRGTSCCVVLIGSQTATRWWVSYEISTAWNEGKGVLGVYIHNLKNLAQAQSAKGTNPLSTVTLNRALAPLSTIARAYDPPLIDSKAVYAYIKSNLASWMDEAIATRNAN